MRFDVVLQTSMAAIAELFVAVAAFIFEVLMWSLVGFYRLVRAVFSEEKREELKLEWARGGMPRAKLAIGAVAWIPVYAIGFGLGAPLLVGVLTSSPAEVDRPLPTLEGVAEISIPGSAESNTEIKLKIDRSRLMELKQTESIADLVKKFDEISTVSVEEKKVEQAAAANEPQRSAP